MEIEQEYNQIFSNKDADFNPQIMRFLSNVLKYKKTGTVLDIGAGLGQNSIFLAKNGFQVEAVDISDESVKIIKEKSVGLNILVRKSDIKTEPLVSDYDIIISSFILHHFTKKERNAFFEMIQKHTTQGGLNIVSAFVAKEEPFEKTNEKGYPIYLLKSDELKEVYSKWEVLNFEQIYSKPLYPSKPPLVEYAETILTRKPL